VDRFKSSAACVHLQDAADNNAIGEHVEIVIVPFA
jgi:hypothetical protein